MAEVSKITGLKTILKNLANRTERMAKRCEQGLLVCGSILKRESQRRVPVDTGNLKASAYVRAKGRGFRTQVFVGYSSAAPYALYVHEKVEMKWKGLPRKHGKGRYWDPQGRAQAKFLEGPARELAPQFKKLLWSFMRIK